VTESRRQLREGRSTRRDASAPTRDRYSTAVGNARASVIGRDSDAARDRGILPRAIPSFRERRAASNEISPKLVDGSQTLSRSRDRARCLVSRQRDQPARGCAKDPGMRVRRIFESAPFQTECQACQRNFRISHVPRSVFPAARSPLPFPRSPFPVPRSPTEESTLVRKTVYFYTAISSKHRVVHRHIVKILS